MKPIDPHHSHENCLALFERLSEYIDRELDAPTCKDIEAHLQACKPCQVCLETLKQTVAFCRNLERHQVPETFSLKLKTAIFDLVDKKGIV
jgi:anti-sigma factor RsiW